MYNLSILVIISKRCSAELVFCSCSNYFSLVVLLWCCITGQVAPDILMVHSAFIFWVKQSVHKQ